MLECLTMFKKISTPPPHTQSVVCYQYSLEDKIFWKLQGAEIGAQRSPHVIFGEVLRLHSVNVVCYEVKIALTGLHSAHVRRRRGRWDCGCDSGVWFEYLPTLDEQWSITSVSAATPCWQLLNACNLHPSFFPSVSRSPFSPFSINFLSLSWWLSHLPSFASVFPALPLFLYPPQWFLSHLLARFSCSFYLSCCRLAWGYHKWGVRGQMEIKAKQDSTTEGARETQTHLQNAKPLRPFSSVLLLLSIF